MAIELTTATAETLQGIRDALDVPSKADLAGINVEGIITAAERAKLAGIETGAQVNYGTKNSIQVDLGSLQLLGDVVSPGASKYYGTNVSGVRGFFDLPAGGGGGGTVEGFDAAEIAFVLGYPNRKPNASEEDWIPVGYDFNLGNVIGFAAVATTADKVFNVKNGSTTIGTVTFLAGSDQGTFNLTGSAAFADTDVLTIAAPASQDVSLAWVQFLCKGTRIASV